jgi:DNA-binding NtrC family response regulator
MSKPIRLHELTRIVAAAVSRRRARRIGASEPKAEHVRLVGESEAMRRLRSEVETAASLNTPVLIVGETGVGKRRVAEAIHAASSRAAETFVVIDCGGSVESLFPTTGSSPDSERLAAFDEAIGGTLYLENVGEMLPAVQSRFVRLLQPARGGIESSGWNPSVRIIASSHRDVSVLRRLGAFRDDLYFRLAATEIHVPPLRDRRDDVPLLAEFALGHAASGSQKARIAPSALHLMQNYPWPGNDHELESVLAAAVIESRDGVVTPEHIGPRLRASIEAGSPAAVPGVTFAEMERYLILSTYEACKHNVTRTAEVLGLSPRTIHYRLREYRGLGARRRPRFGPDAEADHTKS